MEAARGGFKDIVEELAKRGADLNMRTVRIKIISLLLPLKSNISWQQLTLYTLYWYCIYRKLVNLPSMRPLSRDMSMW